MIDSKIIHITKQVRQKCFNFAMSKVSKDCCFHGNETLENMCAFASFVLYKTLLSYGFNNVKFCRGYFWESGIECSHCWVEYDDSFIIDITATQFGSYNEIHIVNVLDEKYDLCGYHSDIYDLGWDDCCINGTSKLVLDMEKELVYNE